MAALCPTPFHCYLNRKKAEMAAEELHDLDNKYCELVRVLSDDKTQTIKDNYTHDTERWQYPPSAWWKK